MNLEQIESLLRKAPFPAPPNGLREQLITDINLPQKTTMNTPTEERPEKSWLRRWMPVLAYALILLSCVTLMAVQASQLRELRRQNEQLRQATASLTQLREENAEYEKLVPLAREAEQLRKANQERPRWEQDVASLRTQLAEITTLRAENERLRAEHAAAAQAAAEEDALTAARDKAMRIRCVNNLKQIGLAARIWEVDHGEVLPGAFQTMSNELNTPKILVCPADAAKVAAPNWLNLTAGNISYEFLSPGINASNAPPQAVLFRCPIHDNVGLFDGSVQQLPPGKFRLEKRGDFYFLVR